MKNRGFTLIELLVVVAIIGIVAAMSFVKISYRMKVSKLEESAQSLMSDLNYARSAAMMKGCPIRLVFCQDRNCASLSDSASADPGGAAGAIGSGSTPSRYYAFLRMSQAVDQDSMCWSEDAIADDGFSYWDFDRRPQMISAGVYFSPIYESTSTLPDASNWSDTTSAEAANALWFNDDGELTIPMTGTANVPDATVDYFIAFQVRLDDCNPAADDDCLGFLIATPQASGQAKMIRCNTGSRGSGATSSNTCF